MEPFTLIVWIMMGMRFEEIRIENLGRGECVERLMTIRGDRSLAKGQYIGAAGYVLPMDRPPQICSYHACWPMLAGRKRG